MNRIANLTAEQATRLHNHADNPGLEVAAEWLATEAKKAQDRLLDAEVAELPVEQATARALVFLSEQVQNARDTGGVGPTQDPEATTPY